MYAETRGSDRSCSGCGGERVERRANAESQLHGCQDCTSAKTRTPHASRDRALPHAPAAVHRGERGQRALCGSRLSMWEVA